MRARIWAAIVVSSIGWGTAGIATRAALREGVGPYTIIGMRVPDRRRRRLRLSLVRRRPLPDRRLWALGGVIGLTNITAPYILFTLAVQHASAGFLSLIITNIPLATARLGPLPAARREAEPAQGLRPGRWRWPG